MFKGDSQLEPLRMRMSQLSEEKMKLCLGRGVDYLFRPNHSFKCWEIDTAEQLLIFSCNSRGVCAAENIPVKSRTTIEMCLSRQ